MIVNQKHVRKLLFAWFLFMAPFAAVLSQHSNLVFNLESSAGYITKGKIPFWLRSNQFGSVPLDNGSLSFTAAVRKNYDVKKRHTIGWGGAVEARANIGQKSNFTLIEGYGKVHISIFQLKAGRYRETVGLCDSSLSSGAFSVSGNALGIPSVQLSIPDFYTLPFFGELFAFKGAYVYGWMGDLSVKTFDESVIDLKTYLHQKSFYGRFGKPEWNIKLYGGFNHQATWGSEKDIYGSLYTLTPFETYVYVVRGKPYSTEYIPSSKIGNHLGSIDMGLEYSFRNIRLMAYRQNIYDIGALYYLANIRDGLNGLSIENKKIRYRGFQWKKMLVEFFYSKNQAGEFWSPETPSGDEDYYNNYQYTQGWSYKGIGIGNPLIGTRDYIKEDLPANPVDYFINNRVIALHFGFEGAVKDWQFELKSSYSWNYGTYGTSEVGHTFGKIRTMPEYGTFEETKQFSGYLKSFKSFDNGLNIGLITAFDVGDLYNDSFGMLVTFTKHF